MPSDLIGVKRKPQKKERSYFLEQEKCREGFDIRNKFGTKGFLRNLFNWSFISQNTSEEKVMNITN